MTADLDRLRRNFNWFPSHLGRDEAIAALDELVARREVCEQIGVKFDKMPGLGWKWYHPELAAARRVCENVFDVSQEELEELVDNWRRVRGKK